MVKVPSVELCQKLWENGITKKLKTDRGWQIVNFSNIILIPVKSLDIRSIGTHWIPAPDISEIRELLPNGIYGKTHTVWAILDPDRLANILINP